MNKETFTDIEQHLQEIEDMPCHNADAELERFQLIDIIRRRIREGSFMAAEMQLELLQERINTFT